MLGCNKKKWLMRQLRTAIQGENFKTDACSDLSEGSIRKDDEIGFKN